MPQPTSAQIQKALKIKALRDKSSFAEERDAAKIALEAYCNKYGITEAHLMEGHKIKPDFDFKDPKKVKDFFDNLSKELKLNDRQKNILQGIGLFVTLASIINVNKNYK